MTGTRPVAGSSDGVVDAVPDDPSALLDPTASSIPDEVAVMVLRRAADLLMAESYSEAIPILEAAVERWPTECDLHRALAFTRSRCGTADTAREGIASMFDSRGTFDRMVAQLGLPEQDTFTTTWTLPTIPIRLPLVTARDVSIAHAAYLAAEGHSGDAYTALFEVPSTAPLTQDAAVVTDMMSVLVFCQIEFRRGHWYSLLDAAAVLQPPADDSDIQSVLMRTVTAIRGAALLRMGASAGLKLLESAAAYNYRAISSWAWWQMGLFYRSRGDEVNAQAAFGNSLIYEDSPKVREAILDTSIAMELPHGIGEEEAVGQADAESDPDSWD
ncbi:hypothetical protein [Mycolicibacterium conceptionense]|uniref:hypothetical protein n=1 Tax=Mycolicibacterium conceptionense TaxID=451644 RepID=UPI000B19F3A3|nr:hypothetical protein [Mycolicibacterium conceptionense]